MREFLAEEVKSRRVHKRTLAATGAWAAGAEETRAVDEEQGGFESPDDVRQLLASADDAEVSQGLNVLTEAGLPQYFEPDILLKVFSIADSGRLLAECQAAIVHGLEVRFDFVPMHPEFLARVLRMFSADAILYPKVAEIALRLIERFDSFPDGLIDELIRLGSWRLVAAAMKFASAVQQVPANSWPEVCRELRMLEPSQVVIQRLCSLTPQESGLAGVAELARSPAWAGAIMPLLGGMSISTAKISPVYEALFEDSRLGGQLARSGQFYSVAALLIDRGRYEPVCGILKRELLARWACLSPLPRALVRAFASATDVDTIKSLLGAIWSLGTATRCTEFDELVTGLSSLLLRDELRDAAFVALVIVGNGGAPLDWLSLVNQAAELIGSPRVVVRNAAATVFSHLRGVPVNDDVISLLLDNVIAKDDDGMTAVQAAKAAAVSSQARERLVAALAEFEAT